MRNSRIKAKLAQNKPALCTTLTLADPVVFELTSLMGFDGIWLDLEHHGHSVETAGRLVRAARVGKSDIVARPAKGELMRMGGELGQVREGYLADLLLVDGNPLADIAIMADRNRFAMIMKDGAIHKDPRAYARDVRIAAE
jgi:hypothetical protein